MRKTILIADTDVVLLELLRSRCVLLGLNVETASRGDDAVRAVEQLQPDLLCIQSGLPYTEGLSVCDALVRDGKLGKTPLIVLCDKRDASAGFPERLPTAYIVPRSGNLWHRMEPLLYELLDSLEQDQRILPSTDHARAAAAEHARKGGLEKARRERALRVDEPAWAHAKQQDGDRGQASRTPPRLDARDEVLDSVFALFGDGERAGTTDAATACLSGPHRRKSAEPPWVLCIEDDDDLSMALKLRLEARGVAVVRAFDGTAGYRTAFTHPASVILLDYNLPQGQGDYVLRRLKDNPVTADVPVIVITGIRSAATRRQMLSLGADAYLTKPIDFAELMDVLGEHVDLLPADFAAVP